MSSLVHYLEKKIIHILKILDSHKLQVIGIKELCNCVEMIALELDTFYCKSHCTSDNL